MVTNFFFRVHNTLCHLSSVSPLTHFWDAAMSHRDLAACMGNAWNTQRDGSHRRYASTPRNLSEESRNPGTARASDLRKRCATTNPFPRRHPMRYSILMIGPAQRGAPAPVRVILYKYAPINATNFPYLRLPLDGRSYFSPMYLFVVPATRIPKTGTVARVSVLRLESHYLPRTNLFLEHRRSICMMIWNGMFFHPVAIVRRKSIVSYLVDVAILYFLHWFYIRIA